jgi:hypothetical protein
VETAHNCLFCWKKRTRGGIFSDEYTKSAVKYNTQYYQHPEHQAQDVSKVLTKLITLLAKGNTVKHFSKLDLSYET